MLLNRIMEEQKITKYRLAKNSGIPYATISDICNGKAQLEKCSAETIYKIAKELNVSMETLLAPYVIKRISFELFKSNVCHRLKQLGDVDFMIEVLEKDDISAFYERKWYPEALYLLAMLDYISNQNAIPLCNQYDRLRQCRLNKTIYPSSILATIVVAKKKEALRIAERNAIPEFMQYGIVENEVRNVI